MNRYFTFESEELGPLDIAVKIITFEGIVDHRILSITDSNGVEYDEVPAHEKKLFELTLDKEIDESFNQ